jgi:hypothetical protein
VTALAQGLEHLDGGELRAAARIGGHHANDLHASIISVAEDTA